MRHLEGHGHGSGADHDRHGDHEHHEHHHGHSHAHGHHHHHAHGVSESGRLYLSLALILSFAVVEVIGGFISGSLALLSDAGHMFSDGVALGLAALATWVARKPPSSRHSYGYRRAEVLAALFNGLLMLAVITTIVVEAVSRLRSPQPVTGGLVMLIALVGLVINILVAFVLSRGAHSINTRAALLHVMGDLLGSVAALLAGAVIYFTGWYPIDPILSIAVAGLILISTVRLLKEALHVLMEGVPPHLQLEDVGRSMAKLPHVHAVHDLHIWTLSSGQTALSAHVEMESLEVWPEVLARTKGLLKERFEINHVTLQPEVIPYIDQPYEMTYPIRPHDSFR